MKYKLFKKNVFIQKSLSEKKGFALLFTVLIVTLLLSVSLGISNMTFKQTILSNLAKDSLVAFYDADGALDCGLYYDIGRDIFPENAPFGPTTPGSAPRTLA